MKNHKIILKYYSNLFKFSWSSLPGSSPEGKTSKVMVWERNSWVFFTKSSSMYIKWRWVETNFLKYLFSLWRSTSKQNQWYLIQTNTKYYKLCDKTLSGMPLNFCEITENLCKYVRTDSDTRHWHYHCTVPQASLNTDIITVPLTVTQQSLNTHYSRLNQTNKNKKFIITRFILLITKIH